MTLLCGSLVLLAGCVLVDTLHLSPSAPYGPLCWGPGIWPHPENCRLFTICLLKDEVKGQLYVCPKNTGFSTKHLRCIAKDKVPVCRMSAPFSEKKLSESSAVRFSEDTEKPARELCYKKRSSTPFCLDDNTLVVCGPREALLGTADCSRQNQVGAGRCDREVSSCVVKDEQHPLSAEEVQNITATLLEEIAVSNITLFPIPSLPSTSEISCARAGLQCYDNVTIIDCTDDETEPNFIMSCSNIIQTTENATGYCNTDHPSCALLIDNFLLNMEISNQNPEMGFADIDEDYEGPELYDSDNLRESPDDFFEGLSWFRHEPNASPSGSLQGVHSSDGNAKRRGKDLLKTQKENERKLTETFGKFESHKIPVSAVERSLQKICQQGGLVCFDNATLVACSGNEHTPTYAVECYGEAVSASGRRLQAFCDQTINSCVVNVDDAPDADTDESYSRNVEVLHKNAS